MPDADSMKWVGDLASYATLLTFFVSFIVFLRTWNIRKQYLFLVRVPRLMESLKKHASTLLRESQGVDRDDQEIALVLSKMSPILDSANKKLSGKSKTLCRGLVQYIKTRNMNIMQNTENEDFELYKDVVKLIDTVSLELEDKHLRG